MEKKKIEAKIVADSASPKGHRITTFLLTYPRFIHSELMTHRVFSRNSASSRAIPFEKIVKMVEEDPFIPIVWQKSHKGMQGTEYLTDEHDIEVSLLGWLEAKDEALDKAKYLNNCGVTKQLCNRLLEPFMWHTVLVTATEYDNFFELRCPKYEYLGEEFRSRKDAINSYTFEVGFEKERLYLTSLTELDWIKLSKSGAEIHIQALAEAMWDAMNESKPKELKAGEWHLPFSDKIDDGKLAQSISPNEALIYSNTSLQELRLKVCVSRCARLSYINHDGKIDYQKDIELHDRLLASKHASSMEHCARVMSNQEYDTFLKGQLSLSSINAGTKSYTAPRDSKDIYGWCDNFKGFISYRHLIENK